MTATEDALALSHKAEALIAEGDGAEGMPLLLSALDLDPCCVEALEILGMVAAEDPALCDALFSRLDAALRKADSSDVQKRVLWLRLTHAAFFDRLEIVRGLALGPGALVAGDAAKAAAMGALLIELGEAEQGTAQLNQVASEGASEGDNPLAHYHLARLDLEKGNRDEARRRLEGISQKGIDGILRELGIHLLDLATPSRELLSSAKVLIARAEQWENPLGPHVYSEVLWLKMKVAIAEGRSGDAEWAAEQLGMPIAGHDPSVMLRAKRILGQGAGGGEHVKRTP